MTRAVLRKELAVLWTSPLPYLVGVLFNATAAVLFVDQLDGRRQAVVQPLFPIAGFLAVALLPLLAMRTLAEERRTGALDVLLAVPVSKRVLVTGKWLATTLTAALDILPSLALVGLVAMWGDPDWGPVLTGYLGLLLLAMCTASIGVLASAATDMQAVAAAAALFVNLLLWFSYAAPDGTHGVLGRLSFSERLRSAAGGAVDSGDAGYFVVVTVVCLSIGVVVLQGARLRAVGIVALLVALGGLATVVLDRSSRTFDMTADNTLSLTDTSRAVTRSIDDDVRVTAFLRRSEPGRAEASALLARYKSENRRISFRVVDPDDAPGEVRRLGVDPVLGGLAVEGGERVERGPTASEQDVTSALARLQREDALQACFTSGHGERRVDDTSPAGMSSLVELLRTNGYGTVTAALSLGADVPASCDVVVITGPTASFTGDAVQHYLTRGGRVLLLTDPESSADVSGLLAGSGLAVERGVVIEGRDTGHVPGDPATPVVAEYRSGFPFVRRLPPTFYPGAQAIVVTDEGEGVAAAAVATTTASARLDGSTRPVTAPIALVAASDRSRVDGGAIVRSRVVVTGDVDFASNAFVGELGNGLLLLQAVDWLTLQEDLVAVSANLPRPRPLLLTSARITYARVLGIAVVPLAFVLACGLVWAVRRDR